MLINSIYFYKSYFALIFPKTLYKAAKVGSKISPFCNKFEIDIYEETNQEAYEIALEKKVLKI